MLLNSGQSSQIKQYSQPWESTFKIFITQFRNPLIFIFIGTNFIAFSLGKFVNGVVVISVILIKAVIRIIQEFQAGKAVVTVEGRVVATGNRTEIGEIKKMDIMKP